MDEVWKESLDVEVELAVTHPSLSPPARRHARSCRENPAYIRSWPTILNLGKEL